MCDRVRYCIQTLSKWKNQIISLPSESFRYCEQWRICVILARPRQKVIAIEINIKHIPLTNISIDSFDVCFSCSITVWCWKNFRIVLIFLSFFLSIKIHFYNIGFDFESCWQIDRLIWNKKMCCSTQSFERRRRQTNKTQSL